MSDWWPVFCWSPPPTVSRGGAVNAPEGSCREAFHGNSEGCLLGRSGVHTEDGWVGPTALLRTLPLKTFTVKKQVLNRGAFKRGSRLEVDLEVRFPMLEHCCSWAFNQETTKALHLFDVQIKKKTIARKIKEKRKFVYIFIQKEKYLVYLNINYILF